QKSLERRAEVQSAEDRARQEQSNLPLEDAAEEKLLAYSRQYRDEKCARSVKRFCERQDNLVSELIQPMKFRICSHPLGQERAVQEKKRNRGKSAAHEVIPRGNAESIAAVKRPEVCGGGEASFEDDGAQDDRLPISGQPCRHCTSSSMVASTIPVSADRIR